ncbi:MAG TPA: hypothetical protein DCZ41_03200 [Firmicutes bacterium]|nr:hypothetical protein [Bacillota bacterium]
MRLKRVFAIALPLFLSAAIVGGGFSVFVFDALVRKEDQADLEITKKVPENFGTLHVSFGSQNDTLYAPDGTLPKLIVDQNGIEFPSPINFTYQWSFQDDTSLSFGDFTYTFKYKIELSDEFSSYFQFYLPDPSLEKSLEGLWYGDSENISLSDFESPISSSVSISLGYRSGMEPDTKESYQKLREIVWNEKKANSLIRFNFEVVATHKE